MPENMAGDAPTDISFLKVSQGESRSSADSHARRMIR